MSSNDNNTIEEPKSTERNSLLKLSPQERKDLEHAVGIRTETALEAGEIVFQSSVFALISLPSKDPGKDVPFWHRSNAGIELFIRPEMIPTGPTTAEYLWPHGFYSRLILMWIATEIKKNNNVTGRTVYLGKSIREFMESLGITYGKKERQAIERHFKALAGSYIRLDSSGVEGSQFLEKERRFALAEEAFTFWDADEKGNKIGKEKGYFITLNKEFYEMLANTAMPIDMRAIKFLRAKGSSTLALDIYYWLAYRLHALRRPTIVTWLQLSRQFGGDYTRMRDFRHNFMKQLNTVLQVYPGARVGEVENGIALLRSEPPVAKRITKQNS